MVVLGRDSFIWLEGKQSMVLKSVLKKNYTYLGTSLGSILPIILGILKNCAIRNCWISVRGRHANMIKY